MAWGGDQGAEPGAEGVQGWAPGSDRQSQLWAGPGQHPPFRRPGAQGPGELTPVFRGTSLWPTGWVPSSLRTGRGKDTGQAAAPALTGLEDPLQVPVELPLDLLLPAQLQEGPTVLHPLALLGKLAVRQREQRGTGCEPRRPAGACRQPLPGALPLASSNPKSTRGTGEPSLLSLLQLLRTTPWSPEGAPEGRDIPARPAWSRLGIALCDQHRCLPPYRQPLDRVPQGALTFFLLLVQTQSTARGRRDRQEEGDSAGPGQARDRPPASPPSVYGSRPAAESTSPPWPQRTAAQPSSRLTEPGEASMHTRTQAHMHTQVSGLAAPSQLRRGAGCRPTAKEQCLSSARGSLPGQAALGVQERAWRPGNGAQARQGGRELGSDQDRPLARGQCPPGPETLQSSQ